MKMTATALGSGLLMTVVRRFFNLAKAATARRASKRRRRIGGRCPLPLPLMIAAIGYLMNCNCSFGEIQGVPFERESEAISFLQAYGFEELPNGGTSCGTAEQPAIPNPLVYDAFTIGDPVCIKSRFCGTAINCQTNPNNVMLVLSDDGATIVFPNTPNLVAFEMLVQSGFQVRITDGNGTMAVLNAGLISPGRLSVDAFQAAAGIAMIELQDFGPNQLASILVENTPAPPLSPGNLTATAISPTAIELAWTDYSVTEHGFLVERKVGVDGAWEVRASENANVTNIVMSVEPSTQYFFRVRAINDAGYSLYSNEATARTPTEFKVTFEGSRGADGFVVERSENANVGEVVVADLAGPGALRAGDTAADQQYKAFVSFDTAAIPNHATVVAGKLRLTRGMVTGTNPFSILGRCIVDIKTGAGFSGHTALQPSDFQAPANQRSAGVLTKTGVATYEATIAADALAFVNKTGRTQFRIYFRTDDNDDHGADWIGWYSAETSEPLNRPQLEVTYWR
jgi:hypothetical protein